MQLLGLFFDLDGTLVNSLGDICAMLNRTRRDYGLAPKPSTELKSYIGKGVEHLMAHGVPELPDRLPELIEKYRHYYLTLPQTEGAPYPGVRDLLRQLERSPMIRMGIVTNKLSSVAERTLAAYLPEVTFDLVYGPDRVPAKKPDARHLLSALGKLGVERTRSWFVGDDPVDRQCAEAAGVRFLGAGYGFGGVEVPPEARLDAFSELRERIPELAALPS